MIVVIIAGGSGTRLWPLSTPEYPKHLLKLNDDNLSLLQHTYERARELTSSIYVVSEVGHIQHVKDQLPELPESAFIAEPARRGTANCIVAALAEVSKQKEEDEPIVFLAADHHIRDTDGFAHSFNVAANISQESGRIVLVGVEPNYPATGFGYIQKDSLFDDTAFVFNVHSFKEKPDYNTAQSYIKSGNYLWNCGYFVGSIQTFKQAMERFAPDLLVAFKGLLASDQGEYRDTYLALENNSIDYALIENVDNLLVLPASFDWLDLGSFADLTKAIATDPSGNSCHGYVEIEEVNNSYMFNSENKPVAVIGLDNCVIINTPDGILVTRKDLSQKVGDVSKRINASK